MGSGALGGEARVAGVATGLGSRVGSAAIHNCSRTNRQAAGGRTAEICSGRMDRCGSLCTVCCTHKLAGWWGTQACAVVDAERSACRPSALQHDAPLTQKGAPAPPVQPLENRRAPESPPPPAIRPRAASPRHENAHSSRERAEWAGAHHLRQGLTAASGGKCSALPMDLNTVPDYKHGRPVVDQSSASR